MDVDAVLGKHQQVGLLGAELERDQPAGTARIAKYAQAGAAGDPPVGWMKTLRRHERAVGVGAQVAPPEQRAAKSRRR